MSFELMVHDPAAGVIAPSTWGDRLNANIAALNAGFRINLPLTSAIVPLSGVAGAALELVESSGAGTVKPVIYQLRCDDTTAEGRMWNIRVPRIYGIAPTLVGSYKMASANVSKSVVLNCQIAAISDGDTHSTKVFDSVNALVESVPDTADESDEFSLTLTNDDSMVADDWLCIVLFRGAANGSDDAAGDFILTSLALNYSFAA